MNRLFVCLTASLALLTPAAAEAQSAADLAGIWERVKTPDSEAKYYKFEADGEGLRGTMLTPPKGMTCTVSLSLEGETWTGAATFEEPEYEPIVTKWEFSAADGKLTGRSEWVSWDDDGNESRGWEQHTLVPVAPVGLATEGSADEAPFGDPVEPLNSLDGGWEGPGGPWQVRVDAGEVTLKPVGHHPEVLVTLKDERGILRGSASLEGGEACDVELAYDEGRLVGRSSWVQGAQLGEEAVRGWSPITFSRLERREAGPEGAAAEAPAASEGNPVGVWKRDDGLYLRVREEAGEVVGVLSTAEGEAQARLRFGNQDGVWIGTANWGDYETRWELSVGDDALAGRAEWVDVHEGQVIARGWSGRSFARLQKIQ